MVKYQILAALLIAGDLIATLPCLARTPPTAPATGGRGSQVLLKQPIIDGHNDLPRQIFKGKHNKLKDFHVDLDLREDAQWKNCPMCHTDIPRLEKGHVGAQFWSAFVPCDTDFKGAVEQTFEQIDVIRRLVQRYPDHLQYAESVSDIEAAIQKGKLASLIGVEGGHSIGSKLSVLRAMYTLGARYLTLTHSCSTPWATASPVNDDVSLVDKGLSSWGKDVVREINRLGMMVDLSHVSIQTMKDALKISKAPVIFSHSSAHAICSVHRNVQDGVLQMVTTNGGVVMVNFASKFVNCNSSREATIHDVVDHINHIRKVGGVDHVGIGADYDGVSSLPIGLEDVSKYPDLFDLLAEPSQDDPAYWSDEDLIKLAGGNLLRVFRAVEELRDKMAEEEISPLEEWIPQEDLDSHLESRA